MNNLKQEHQYIMLALPHRHQFISSYTITNIFLGFSQIYITCCTVLLE